MLTVGTDIEADTRDRPSTMILVTAARLIEAAPLEVPSDIATIATPTTITTGAAAPTRDDSVCITRTTVLAPGSMRISTARPRVGPLAAMTTEIDRSHATRATATMIATRLHLSTGMTTAIGTRGSDSGLAAVRHIALRETIEGDALTASRVENN